MIRRRFEEDKRNDAPDAFDLLPPHWIDGERFFVALVSGPLSGVSGFSQLTTNN
jgi:hypothetical protein